MGNDSTERIAAQLRAWLATAPAGSRVPSNRELAARHGASPVTVQRAMRSVAALGLIESRPGVGTFVRAARTAAAVDYGWQTAALGSASGGGVLPSTQRGTAPDAIGLHSGYPAGELLPERLVRAAITRAARSEAALLRSPAAGMPELQAWFAAELGEHAPPDIPAPSARDVTVLAGSQSGLSSIFRALVGPGHPLLIESPTYWGAIVAARQAGVVLVPVPSGPDGPDPQTLDRAFADSGARAFYAQPTFANPTGGQWSPQLGAEVLDIARRRAAFVIEDDWARDFGIDRDARPLAAHDPGGHVVYLRSLTKTASPALRIAAVIARGPARDRILVDRAAESMYVSGVLQAAALDVVSQPGWRTHLRALRPRLRARRDLLLTALHEHAPIVRVQSPVGGLNLWARLPDHCSPEQVAAQCEARGVIVAAGTEWFPAEPSAQYIRLNYAGPDPERYPEAARVIGEVVAAAG